MKNNSMFARFVSLLLVLTMVFTAIPATVFATEAEPVTYGDVNEDSKIDVRDILALQKYILGVDTQKINTEYADVNGDNAIDLKDLLLIKKYIAEWDVVLGPGTAIVSFYDGDRLIEQLEVNPGEAPGQVPSNEKTSRSDGIFLGWYTDPEFKTPFYADSPVQKDTKVYAKYSKFETSTLTVTSFAQTDLTPDASFQVVGEGDLNAITLITMDGSDPVKLKVTGDGPYTIAAQEGFVEGASYELTLPEGLNFVGSTGETMPETVRTASFTIARKIVDNIQMSDSVHYVKHNNPASLKAGSQVQVSGVKAGDLLCFYKTTNPAERDYTSGNAYMDDPETWFKVASISGGKVKLAELDESDNQKMYEVPDNFPVIGKLPTKDTGKLTLTNDSDGYVLDVEFYTQMVENPADATMEKALEKLSVGDFISIYVSSESIEEEDDIFFGKVTEVKNGTLTYVKSSAEEIEAAADLHIKPVVEGEDLVSEQARQEIEETVAQQLSDSGFAEEAAYLLVDLATKTDGFQNMEGVQMLFTDENGEPLSDEEIQLLNLGASFELSDDVELKVEVITSGDQLHFKDVGAVQLAVGIDASFEVEAEEGKLVIDLSASFVQELALGVTADGSLVKKKILFIPVPIGVKVGASVDLMSYTGVRVDVHGYTVGEEDESLFDQFKDVVKNPEKLADVLPDSDKYKAVAEGLKTVGDVFDKIEELEGQVQQVQDDAETAAQYTKDLITLWNMVGDMKTDKKVTKDEWKQLGETFGKTDVSKDLMEMMNLTTETELDADRYADGLSGLLEKYSEMLEEETDWITLVEEEMCTAEVNVYGLVIFFKADFVVRADINIAMGASIQYEVGKRYSFWFKIGLFKPEAGSSTMDLVDESFAFQFYVMGKIGLKMGIKATVGFAIGSSKLASVGLSLEVGPYIKIYGFFIYEYERMRKANTSTWESSERMAGALYIDFGLYMIVSLEASALGDLFEVEHTFVDEEFPLLEVGRKKYPYQFQYEPMEGELVVVQDADGNSTNGVAMVLPDEYRALSYCNLETGYLGAQAFDWDNYNVTLSNPAFSINKKGEIKVDVPKNTRYMECDMTLTYKYGKLAFSTYDMQVVVPLVWTNLSLDEISQYFTASVRIGNDTDGYSIAWSKRVRKNEKFTLPTEEELKKLIGYNEAMYSSFSFPDAGKTADIITNTSYDCIVDYTDYAITVNGVQKADGTTTSKTFHTTYGSVFDFSALDSTGTSISGTAETAKYTKFANVTTEATVTANGQTRTIDLTQPITGKVAEAILAGKVTATANYVDNSALVTYVFTGINAPNVTERVRKGTEAAYDIYSLVAEYGMSVKDVTPTLGKITGTTNYYVQCGQLTGKQYTLSFVENGGKTVKDIVRVGGSLIGTLPTPTRAGYTFQGWFTDKNLTKAFDSKLMPKKNVSVYAKWKANSYQVTLNVNGGNAWEGNEGKLTVTYGKAYGKLPVPVRDGYGFQGWYTTKTCDEGTQVTATTVAKITANQTLYAKWRKLVQIEGTFTYTALETNPIYSKGVAVEIKPDDNSWPVAQKGAPALKAEDFTIKFMRQGDNEYAKGYPVNAGTYDVTITRPGDDYYAPFSQNITGVLTIEKATRTIEQPKIKVTASSRTYMDIRLAKDAIDDLHPNAKITYEVEKTDGTNITSGYGTTMVSDDPNEVIRVLGLFPDSEYVVRVSVTEDLNYYDAVATNYSPAGKTATAPTDSWKNHMEPFEIKEGVYEYTITTPGQLAYLAYLVNTTTSYNAEPVLVNTALFDVYYASYSIFDDYTFKLGADLDLSAYTWEPIGNDFYQITKEDYKVTSNVTGVKTTYYYNYFGGTFSGNGYTITGMYVDGSIAKEAGENSYESRDTLGALFGYIYGTAQITDVTILDSYVTSTSRSAAVVARATGASIENRVLIENCYSEATITQKQRAAGIVSLLYNGDIQNCVNKGRVHGTGDEGNMGGIVGGAQGVDGSPIKVYNCVNYADISGSSINAAGIVGWSEWANIKSCVNYGSVRGSEDVGGIVGEVNDSSHLTYGNVVDCVNYGNITGTSYHVGGIAGYVVVGRVTNSANFGNIKGHSDCVGGITGEHSKNKNAKTINCVNFGKITGSGKYIGSVIGRNYDNKGTVAPVYYLAYSGAPYAAGTKSGSSNTVENVTAYSFKEPDSTLQSNLGGWSGYKSYGATEWVKDDTGYGYIPESVYELLYKED